MATSLGQRGLPKCRDGGRRSHTHPPRCDNSPIRWGAGPTQLPGPATHVHAAPSCRPAPCQLAPQPRAAGPRVLQVNLSLTLERPEHETEAALRPQAAPSRAMGTRAVRGARSGLTARQPQGPSEQLRARAHGSQSETPGAPRPATCSQLTSGAPRPLRQMAMLIIHHLGTHAVRDLLWKTRRCKSKGKQMSKKDPPCSTTSLSQGTPRFHTMTRVDVSADRAVTGDPRNSQKIKQ